MNELIKLLEEIKLDQRKRLCLGIFSGIGSLGLGIYSITKLIEAGELDGIKYTLEEVIKAWEELSKLRR